MNKRRPFLHISLLIKYPVPQQIRFNDKFFGDKCGFTVMIIIVLFATILSGTLSVKVCVEVWVGYIFWGGSSGEITLLPFWQRVHSERKRMSLTPFQKELGEHYIIHCVRMSYYTLSDYVIFFEDCHLAEDNVVNTKTNSSLETHNSFHLRLSNSAFNLFCQIFCIYLF